MIAGNSVSALALNVLSVEGIITGFDLHNSMEYVFVLSSAGYVAIFKLPISSCKAKIKVPLNSSFLSIDPSGLYFAIGCLPNKYTNVIKNGDQYERKIKQLPRGE